MDRAIGELDGLDARTKVEKHPTRNSGGPFRCVVWERRGGCTACRANGVGANARSEEDWASAAAVTASNSIGSIIVKARAAKATATAVDLQFGGQR